MSGQRWKGQNLREVRDQRAQWRSLNGNESKSADGTTGPRPRTPEEAAAHFAGLGLDAMFAGCVARQVEVCIEQGNFDAAVAAIRHAAAQYMAARDAGKARSIDEALALPLVALGMNQRIVETLERNGVFTVGDAAALSQVQLMKLGEVGPKFVEELVSAVAKVLAPFRGGV